MSLNDDINVMMGMRYKFKDLKRCPLCGGMAVPNLKDTDRVNCEKQGCYMGEPWREWGMTIENWQTRPIEDAQAAEIARLKEAQRWIPVGERLPEDGEPVLVLDGAERHVGWHISAVPQWETENGIYYHGDIYAWITHWMPLIDPEPPQEAK